jgi:hypothetical protein
MVSVPLITNTIDDDPSKKKEISMNQLRAFLQKAEDRPKSNSSSYRDVYTGTRYTSPTEEGSSSPRSLISSQRQSANYSPSSPRDRPQSMSYTQMSRGNNSPVSPRLSTRDFQPSSPRDSKPPLPEQKSPIAREMERLKEREERAKEERQREKEREERLRIKREKELEQKRKTAERDLQLQILRERENRQLERERERDNRERDIAFEAELQKEREREARRSPQKLPPRIPVTPDSPVSPRGYSPSSPISPRSSNRDFSSSPRDSFREIPRVGIPPHRTPSPTKSFRDGTGIIRPPPLGLEKSYSARELSPTRDREIRALSPRASARDYAPVRDPSPERRPLSPRALTRDYSESAIPSPRASSPRLREYSPSSPRDRIENVISKDLYERPLPPEPIVARGFSPDKPSRVPSNRGSWSKIANVVMPDEDRDAPPSPIASAYARLRGSEYEERMRKKRLQLSLRYLNQRVIRTMRLKRIPLVMKLTNSDDMLGALFHIIQAIVKGYLTRRQIRREKKAVIVLQREVRYWLQRRRPFARFKKRIILLQREVRKLLDVRRLQRLTQAKNEKLIVELLKLYKKNNAPLFTRASFLYTARNLVDLRTILVVKKEIGSVNRQFLSSQDWTKHLTSFARMLHRKYDPKNRPSEEETRMLNNFFEIFKIDDNKPLYHRLKLLTHKLFSSTKLSKSQWSAVFVINHLQ